MDAKTLAAEFYRERRYLYTRDGRIGVIDGSEFIPMTAEEAVDVMNRGGKLREQKSSALEACPFLTAEEAAAWLRAHGYAVTFDSSWLVGLRSGLSDRDLIELAERRLRSIR